MPISRGRMLFRHLSVFQRQLLGTLCIIAFSIALGYSALPLMRGMSQDASTAYRHAFIVTNNLQWARESVERSRTAMREQISEADETRKAGRLATLQREERLYRDCMNVVRTDFRGDTRLIDTVESCYTAFISMRDNALTKQKTRDVQESWLRAESSPQNPADQLLMAIDALMHEAHSTAEHLHQPHVVMQRAMLLKIMTIYALFGGVAIAVTGLVSWTIRRRLMALTDHANALAAGDLDIQAPCDGERTEMGAMARALETLRGVARQMTEQCWVKTRLLEAAEALQQSGDPHAFARRLTARAAQAADASHAALSIPGEDGRLHLLASSDATTDGPPADDSAVSELARQCAATHLPARLALPAEEAARFIPGIGHAASAWLHVFPLLRSNRLLGVLEVVTTTPLPPRAITLFETMMPMAALSLEALERDRHMNDLLEQARARGDGLEENRDRLQREVAFFHTVFEAAGIGIVSERDGHGIERVNPAFADFIGIDEPQLRGRDLADFLHPDEHETLNAPSSLNALASPEPDAPNLGGPDQNWPDPVRGAATERAEHRYLRLDGETRWAHVRCVLMDSEDLPRRRLTLISDITAFRDRQAALEDAAAWYRNILHSAPDALLVVDGEGRIVLCNPQFERLLGHETNDLTGHPLAEFLPAEPRERHMAPHDDAPTWPHSLIGHSREVTGVRKDGARLALEINLAALPASGRRPMGACGIVRDISARKHTEAELLRTKEMAEETARLHGVLLTDMGRELHAPVSTLIDMARLALQTGPGPRQSQCVRTMRAAGQHLLGLLDHRLPLPGDAAGAPTARNTEFELETVLDAVAHLTAETATAKGLQLVLDIAPGVPPVLRGDPLRLERILADCARSAVTLTRHDHVVLRVDTLEDNTADVLLRFAVRAADLGPDPAMAKKLAGLSDHHAGLNAGMDAPAGQGRTYWLTARLGRGDGRQPPPPRSDLHGLRVLVADNNAPARAVLAHALEGMAFRPVQTDNSESALRLMCEAETAGSPFGMILLDWQIPDTGGLETIRRIRAQAPELPLVIVTTHGGEDVFAAAEQAGTATVLVKPVPPSLLSDTAMRLLDATRPAQRARRSPPVPDSRRDKARRILDQEAGLRRVMGKRATYHALLHRFVSQHASAAARITACIASGDRTTAMREAHTLKGVAGTLGAPTVQAHAAELESALRHTASAERTAEVLAVLRDALEETVLAMRRLLEDAGEFSEPPPPGPPRQTTGTATSPAGAAASDVTQHPSSSPPASPLPDILPGILPGILKDEALLDRLESLMADDDTEAVDLFATHAKALRTALGPTTVADMGEALRTFEFEAALEMLRSARPDRTDKEH